MADNKSISEVFQLGAQLLSLHGENKFKIRSYQQASRHLESLEEPVADLSTDELERLEGIGANIAKKIQQIRDTGSFDELERLLNRTPEGILELVQIKGIGPKKAAQVWQELGVLSPEDLLSAIREGYVEDLKGWGKKSAKQAEEALTFYEASKGQLILPHADAEAEGILQLLEESGYVRACSITGPLRRRCVTISSLDLLVISEGDIGALVSYLAGSTYLYQPDENDKEHWMSRATGIRVNVHFTSEEKWYQDLFNSTGASAFTREYPVTTDGYPSSESVLFEKMNAPWIPPEMRESYWKDRTFEKNQVNSLVTSEDLKGCLHNHSTYSDGINSLYEMAMACRERGLGYFGVADHSKAAFYANGLSEERVLQQQQAIRELNQEIDPFRIFHGVEVDILKDGQLDFDGTVLKELDYVVASIHAPLKMDEETATQRLLKAIENPYTTMLGHPTGRLLLRRGGYPVDHKKIIDACALHNVIIEINSNPRRLDLDWQWIPYALSKNVLLSINPDAHNTKGIGDMQYGVDVARKAGAPADKIINTYSREHVTTLFGERKQEAIESLSDTV